MSSADHIDLDRLRTLVPLAHAEHYEQISSTQDRAHELAAAPDAPLPLVVVAEEQTAGRGRGTNRWWTGPGSLAMSLVVDPHRWGIEPRLMPQRSLAVAVAIVDTIAATVGPEAANAGLGLHWPNDVFVDGRKLAGTLVDVRPDGRHVIGIGLNVNNSLAGTPDEIVQRATTLYEWTGRHFDRTLVLAILLQQLERSLRACGESPDLFGERFDELCLQTGEELTIEVGGEQTTGECLGVAVDGALRLETASGERRFYSGVLRHERC